MTAAPQASANGFLTLPSHDLAPRRDLIHLMREICRDTGADRYMLVDLSVRSGEHTRIVSSNWIYDAIEMIGLDLISRIAGGSKERRRALSSREKTLLAGQGHVDFLSVPVRTGCKRYALLLSAEAPGRLIARALARVELLCSYALSLLAPASRTEGSPLTDRERECLHWVAEGKTTDEVALILGVSAGTANNYLSNAMQKLGARNRALAVSTAIRQGLI